MVSYDVRVYCETQGIYKRTNQATIDDTWVPAGCAGHTLKYFVIERNIE